MASILRETNTVHELTIARALLESAVDEATRLAAIRIRKILCRIGSLRQVDSAMLREAFVFVRVDSIASEAELVVESVGMRLECDSCGHVEVLDTWGFTCPHCESPTIKLSGGDELELTSLELELPDDDRSPEKEHIREERPSCRAES